LDYHENSEDSCNDGDSQVSLIATFEFVMEEGRQSERERGASGCSDNFDENADLGEHKD